jgi:hypothetical protein
VAVRVNAAGTAHHAADLELCAQLDLARPTASRCSGPA